MFYIYIFFFLYIKIYYAYKTHNIASTKGGKKIKSGWWVKEQSKECFGDEKNIGIVIIKIGYGFFDWEKKIKEKLLRIVFYSFVWYCVIVLIVFLDIFLVYIYIKYIYNEKSVITPRNRIRINK